MKMQILKAGVLLLTLQSLFVLTSCKKDDEDSADALKKEVAGIWDATSFKVAGIEYMNTAFAAASFEFKTYSGAQGDFSQWVQYLDGEEDQVSGKYQVTGADAVQMTYNGITYPMKVNVDGNIIVLEGTQDGQPLVVRAERRVGSPIATVRTKIVGTWDFTSFKVGGSEMMNSQIESGHLAYESFTGVEGDFQQVLKMVDSGVEETVAGIYEIQDNGRVKMTSGDEVLSLKATFNGDQIRLEGIQNGLTLVILAEKRD